MLKKYRKNIYCLESLWNDDVEIKLSVLPALELASRLNDISYLHLTCNTIPELAHNLRRLRKRRAYGILYFAFHGQRGRILLDDKSRVRLDELAEMMGNRFQNWSVHFGSCSVLKARDKDLQEFVEQTGVGLLTGYGKVMEWGESTALDILFFCLLQRYKNTKHFLNFFEKTYPDLIQVTGFRAFVKS
jgi:hypothetical protein